MPRPDYVGKLESERDRLRDALREIVALDDDDRVLGFMPGPEYWHGVEEAADVARAALAAGPDSDRPRNHAEQRTQDGV